MSFINSEACDARPRLTALPETTTTRGSPISSHQSDSNDSTERTINLFKARLITTTLRTHIKHNHMSVCHELLKKVMLLDMLSQPVVVDLWL